MSPKVDVYSVMGGFMHFQYLYCACTFGLFDYLEEHPDCSASDIGTALGLSPYSTKVLLLGVTSVGLLKKKGDTYRNASVASKRLRKHSADSIVPTIDFFHHAVYQPMFRLEESLREGTNAGLALLPGEGDTLYARLESQPELREKFHLWMRVFRHLGLSVGAQTDALRPYLSDAQHLLDVGGGVGDNAVDLCQAFPHLRVTVCDLAEVCAEARRRAQRATLHDRIACCEGNIFHADYPQKADVVLLSHIMEIYSPQQNTALIRKAYDALRGGGRLVIFSPVAYDDGTGPLVASFMSAYFLALASGSGMVHSLADFSCWATEAGFQPTFTHTFGNDNHAIFVATKPAKPSRPASGREETT